jgi:hypothetical protein
MATLTAPPLRSATELTPEEIEALFAYLEHPVLPEGHAELIRKSRELYRAAATGPPANSYFA